MDFGDHYNCDLERRELEERIAELEAELAGTEGLVLTRGIIIDARGSTQESVRMLPSIVRQAAELAKSELRSDREAPSGRDIVSLSVSGSGSDVKLSASINGVELGTAGDNISDVSARNMQDAFADFLFDPFEDGPAKASCPKCGYVISAIKNSHD